MRPLLSPSQSLENRNFMIQTLCEWCASMREVITPKGSRFLLCRLSISNPASVAQASVAQASVAQASVAQDYPKYPPQPIVTCDGYQKKEHAGGLVERGALEEKGTSCFFAPATTTGAGLPKSSSTPWPERYPRTGKQRLGA